MEGSSPWHHQAILPGGYTVKIIYCYIRTPMVEWIIKGPDGLVDAGDLTSPFPVATRTDLQKMVESVIIRMIPKLPITHDPSVPDYDL